MHSRCSPIWKRTPVVVVAAVLLASCTGNDADDADGIDTDTDSTSGEAVDFVASFDPDGLAAPITEEPCTLSSGVETTCWLVELRGAPTDHEVGPFCPRTIDDDASVGGIWLESGDLFDLDGAFISGLASFYADPEWMLYDASTGNVNVTDTREACAAAARPDVDPQYNNHCVECELDYVDGGVATTVLVPKVPVALDAPLATTGAQVVGVALNGVAFDPPAPVAAILAAHTIAAFDDCGGHVNLIAGYHYHAATGCSKQVATEDGHSPLIGYALDGYPLHARTDAAGAEPTDLDACLGHTDAERGYHYHVAGAGENRFVGCFHGDIVATEGGPGDPPVDLPPVGDCVGGQTSMCCGDDVCDGPETADNCPEDCR